MSPRAAHLRLCQRLSQAALGRSRLLQLGSRCRQRVAEARRCVVALSSNTARLLACSSSGFRFSCRTRSLGVFLTAQILSDLKRGRRRAG
jgi:hypothetical protein